MAEESTAEHLNPLLAGTIFAGKVRHFASIPSTNTAAMQAAVQGAEAGTVFIADEQSAGRGRGGHDWHSPPSTGLYISVILRPQLSPNDVLWFSLAAGIATHDALRETCHIQADLRWPNDIMLSTRKLGGILTEMANDPGGAKVKHAVIGIGINVGHESFPEDLAQLATSLRIETGREWPRLPMAGALLQSLHREIVSLQANVPVAGADIIQRFESCSTYVRNARVHVDEDGGYTGVTCGLNERGFLTVKTDTGVKTVLSGGVRKI